MTFWGPEKLPSPDDPEAPPVSPHGRHGARPSARGTTLARGTAHGHDPTATAGTIREATSGTNRRPIMTYPLVALAGCTVLIGLVCLVAGPFAGTTEWFAHHLHSTFGFETLGHFEHHFDWMTAIVGTLAALGGIGLSYVIYGKDEIIISRSPSGSSPCTKLRSANSMLTNSTSG